MSAALRATRILLRLPHLGTATYWRLLNVFPSPEAILTCPAAQLSTLLKPATLETLAQWQLQPQQHSISQLVDREDDWLAGQQDCYLIGFDDERYPALLREISRPPALLYVKGNPACLNLPQLAVVGSRTSTAGGLDNAQAFAKFLAANGFAITSGLARGIDARAHQGALEAGGKTIAVLGTGIDRVYPAQHHNLAEAILANNGALMTEFPPGIHAEAHHFPQRNRLISGMSHGTLVVEAAVKSGSLITARLALEQNREVFAIPGSIHNPLARGCHKLIREGATLVESALDIVEQLGGLLAWHGQQAEAQAGTSLHPGLNPFQLQVLEFVGFDPVDMDTLLERTNGDVGALGAALVELQINQWIGESAEGYYRLR